MRKKLAGALVAAVALPWLLSACGGESGSPAADAPAGPQTFAVTGEVLERGAGVYKINCVACHGPEGKGDGPSAASLDPPPRDHSNREYMDALTDQEIADTIVAGGAPRGYPNMPSNPHIKGDDLVSLVAFVRTLGRGPDGVQEVELLLK
ncbi:MAG: cytochrome c [Thermoanaerobaculia bacterium]|nr:cytochrome c [Thermoanaerobaculia bacterium]